jgi:hypothetical protein
MAAVLAMGENAGVLYSAARSKLDMAMQETIRTVSPGSSPQAVEDGKVLGLDIPTRQDEPSASSDRKFVLHVPIRLRAGEKIQANDVVLIVLFYDKMEGKDIVQTTANTNHRYSSPPMNWRMGIPRPSKSLTICRRRLDAARNGSTTATSRDFTTKNELQDIHAEPAALSQRFPASHTLSE